jgi:Putative transposase
VPYFHVVFPLPPLLNPLMRVNQRPLYNLVFQTVVRTLRQFARDPNHLGAELGITAVLHPWGQTLTEHIHVHCSVTGGGLTAAGTQWRPSHPRCLFAVAALSQVFRGKYLAGLRRLRAKHRLHFAGESAALAEQKAWQAFLGPVQDRPWVVSMPSHPGAGRSKGCSISVATSTAWPSPMRAWSLSAREWSASATKTPRPGASPRSCS